MTLVTLVTGTSIFARESAIAAALEPGEAAALILEGIPNGASPLDSLTADASNYPPHIARIAPGCLCCTGNLTMRVTLNRLLRHSPQRLYISLANSAHIERLRLFLSEAPYDKLLQFTKDLQA